MTATSDVLVVCVTKWDNFWTLWHGQGMKNMFCAEYLELYVGFVVAVVVVVVVVCLFWTWATLPCLQAAAITVYEAIQVFSCSFPLARSPSLQVWKLSTPGLHEEHLYTPASYNHLLRHCCLLLHRPMTKSLASWSKGRGDKDLELKLGSYLMSHVLAVSCFEYPPSHSLMQYQTPTSYMNCKGDYCIHFILCFWIGGFFTFRSFWAGSFNCARIWYNFGRWPCQGAEGGRWQLSSNEWACYDWRILKACC